MCAAVAFTSCMYVLRHYHWWNNTSLWWIDFPHMIECVPAAGISFAARREVGADATGLAPGRCCAVPAPDRPLAKHYNYFYLGFYVHQMVILFYEPKMKDFYVMVTHHIVTILLVLFSFSVGYVHSLPAADRDRPNRQGLRSCPKSTLVPIVVLARVLATTALACRSWRSTTCPTRSWRSPRCSSTARSRSVGRSTA